MKSGHEIIVFDETSWGKPLTNYGYAKYGEELRRLPKRCNGMMSLLACISRKGVIAL